MVTLLIRLLLGLSSNAPLHKFFHIFVLIRFIVPWTGDFSSLSSQNIRILQAKFIPELTLKNLEMRCRLMHFSNSSCV